VLRRNEHDREPYKKKLAAGDLSFKINDPGTGDFAEAYLKVEALLRFYFKTSQDELDNMNADEFGSRYQQLKYALDFDAARGNADKDKKVYLPL
jgi:hypothetical protein